MCIRDRRSLLPALDDDDGVLGAGHGALNEQQVVLDVATDDLETLLGDALRPHVPAHAHALEHSRRVCAGADRTRLPDVVRTVGLRATTEVVPLDGALEPLALAHADGGDGLAILERLDGDGIADLEIVGTVELDQMAHAVLEAGLLEVAQLGLADVLVFALLERQLHGLVAVGVEGADLCDRAGASLDDGDGHDVAAVVEELGHAHLFADDASHSLYSLSLIHISEPTRLGMISYAVFCLK